MTEQSALLNTAAVFFLLGFGLRFLLPSTLSMRKHFVASVGAGAGLVVGVGIAAAAYFFTGAWR